MKSATTAQTKDKAVHGISLTLPNSAGRAARQEVKAKPKALMIKRLNVIGQSKFQARLYVARFWLGQAFWS